MRILAIRGQNLASLAEPFALEFEQEPLRSAGLFAITGETGAGKSTILDALCLALYDEFPRVVAAGGNDDVPDASGDSIKEDDPRTILRRGAARGYAEVDFIGRDGGRYRAKCELMRAYGRASGKLQNRTRSLWRIDESGERVESLESGVALVNRRIVALTDLTFDQFRRTALLAQGDFDAFLRAKPNERGELLEKITGAEIYGRLSMRVYEKAREARDSVAALEKSRQEIGVMADEDRAAILAQSDEIGERRAALDAERQDIAEKLRRLDAHALAQSKLAQAEAERVAADEAFARLAPQRRTLDDLARVAPLRAPRDAAAQAAENLIRKQEASAQAGEQATKAREALAAALDAERTAAAALDAAAQEVAQFAPVWEKASTLDTRIATQAEEAARAQAEEETAVRDAEVKRGELAEARDAESKAHEARDTARQAVEALAGARALSERWAEIDDLLTQRAQAAVKSSEFSDALRKAQEELARAEAIGAEFDRADEADRAALADLAQQIGEREAARAAMDAPAAQQRLDAIGPAHEILREMGRLAEAHDLAREKATVAHEDVIRFEQEAETLTARLAGLQATRGEQARQKEDAERLGDLAEAAADPHALMLRAALAEDEPCPVCGALEHPFSTAADAVQELVDALRARRDSARRALDETDKQIAEVAAADAQARARHRDATQRLAEARAAIESAARDYGACHVQRPHPEAPAIIAGAATAIAGLIVVLEKERKGLEEIVRNERQLTADIALLTKQRDAKHDAIEKRRGERSEIETGAQNAREERARLAEALAGAGERLRSLDLSFSPFLTLCALTTADLERDPDSVRRRLASAGARFREAQEALTRAEQSLVELAQRIARLEAKAQLVAAKAEQAGAERSNRFAALAQSQAERALLLGGEPTAAHRGRIEAKHGAARQAHEAARAAFAEADKNKAACDERSAGAARDVETARAAQESAQAAFATALAGSGLTEEETAPLLAISETDAGAMRAAVEAARTTLAAAETAVAARRGDLGEAEAAGLPETPRAELAAQHESVAATLDELLTQIGVLKQQLAQDDAARGRAETLSREIDSARATSKVWEEINAAIGSKSGDKFRRFAQSVTLEQLVALANQRLALLSPRYRLERSGEVGALGLQIVDRDLGDERRSTRSLSGGERFLASLALALALAGLEGRDSFVDTLFIDEGFGSLDAATLDVAIDALENLQGQGRKVGVISHVESLQSRIATKISVERRGGGVSAIRLLAAAGGI